MLNRTSIDPASCMLDDVTVDLPIYEGNTNFKKALLGFSGRDKRIGSGKARSIKALRNIDMDISLGDRIGLIGPNGAGKTTLLRLLAGAYFPTSGRMEIVGRISSILNVGVGMDTDMSGYDNIVTCCLLLGMDRAQVHEEREKIAEFTGLGDFIFMPVRTYSSGMMLRLSFAIATALEPDILLIDEIIGVGDAAFSEKARLRVDELIADSRILVLASHGESTIRDFCNKVAFLESGRLVYFGGIAEGFERYNAWLAGAPAKLSTH